MRDQNWLENRFEYLYRNFFIDLNAPNQIHIRFGKKARTRLGSIIKKQSKKNRDFETIITINGLFSDEKIPIYILDSVILHELTHYAHGFNSPLPQKYRHPHKGGVVRSELQKRGIDELEKRQKKWMKKNWLKYLDVHLSRKPRKQRKRKVRYVWLLE